VVAHLLFDPAGADPEVHPAAGQHVDGGDRLRRDDGIPLGHQQHGGADPQGAGGLGDGAQRDEGIHAVLELRRHVGDVIAFGGLGCWKSE
jgi:hypothetical protein